MRIALHCAKRWWLKTPCIFIITKSLLFCSIKDANSKHCSCRYYRSRVFRPGSCKVRPFVTLPYHFLSSPRSFSIPFLVLFHSFRYLLSHNAGDTVFDVTVFEARDRLGGRAYTSNNFGVPVDLGCRYVSQFFPSFPLLHYPFPPLFVQCGD